MSIAHQIRKPVITESSRKKSPLHKMPNKPGYWLMYSKDSHMPMSCAPLTVYHWKDEGISQFYVEYPTKLVRGGDTSKVLVLNKKDLQKYSEKGHRFAYVGPLIYPVWKEEKKGMMI